MTSLIQGYIKQVMQEGLNLLDLGSSGNLDEKWNTLKSIINLYGFDPNEEECIRMNSSDLGFRESFFLPYAVSAHSEVASLYLTESHYCTSLLEPNLKWLNRFEFKDLFNIENIVQIKTYSLSQIEEIKDKSFVAVKMDVQGMELPILKSAEFILDGVFYLETENGFSENYFGETTFGMMSEYLSEQGFLLFDLNTNHRIARNNHFAVKKSGREQIMWTESVWLRDFVVFDAKKLEQLVEQDPFLPKKILILCSFVGCLDYGYELASLFHERGFIGRKDYDGLKSANQWCL